MRLLCSVKLGFDNVFPINTYELKIDIDFKLASSNSVFSNNEILTIKPIDDQKSLEQEYINTLGEFLSLNNKITCKYAAIDGNIAILMDINDEMWVLGLQLISPSTLIKDHLFSGENKLKFDRISSKIPISKISIGQFHSLLLSR